MLTSYKLDYIYATHSLIQLEEAEFIYLLHSILAGNFGASTSMFF
jgi:hypothetical protein